jgi:hypothetical protein
MFVTWERLKEKFLVSTSMGFHGLQPMDNLSFHGSAMSYAEVRCCPVERGEVIKKKGWMNRYSKTLF